jgi:acyl carrier protein
MPALELAPRVEWSATQVEALVIELVGDLLNEDPNELRLRLVAKGDSMPVDSLDLFDVLVEFRLRTGITIPKRKLRGHVMRSVTAFSDFIAQEVR